MKALAIAVALMMSASTDPLAETTVGTLKLKTPAAWERRPTEGTTTRFAVASGEAYFDLDVGKVQREGGMPAAECLDKILAGLGDSGFKKTTIGKQPAASRNYVDTDEKGQKFVQYSYVGCDGVTTWSLQFHLVEAKKARFAPLADKIARSIQYQK